MIIKEIVCSYFSLKFLNLKEYDNISKKVINQFILLNSNIYIKNFDKNHFKIELFSFKTDFFDYKLI